MNLIKGGDLDNAIVVVENPVPEEQLEQLKKLFNKPDIEIKAGYLNNLELRCNNELARHKLLDLLGDFALLGAYGSRAASGPPARDTSPTRSL